MKKSIFLFLATFAVSQISFAQVPQLSNEWQENLSQCIEQFGMVTAEELGEETGTLWVFNKMNSTGTEIDAYVYMIVQGDEVRGLIQLETAEGEIKQIRTTTKNGQPSADEIVAVCG